MDALGFISNISWIAALCFVAGFILVMVELHMPGFGVAGISGAILLLLGIILTARSLIEAFVLILIVLIVLGLTATLVLQSAMKGKLNKSLVLSHTLDKSSGYSATEDLEYFIGKKGKTVTVLRPAGIVDFDGVRLDVISESEFIQKDVDVCVVSVQGRRIMVRPIG